MISKQPISRIERIIYFILFILLWAYLWLRAIYVPLVHDEIATFYHYIQTGRFLPYLSHWDANNHFLNSALTWLSYSLFGLHEWSVRLPNLLITPLFFWAVYQLAGLLSNKWHRAVWILSICFNHFFIEYLALSRGYGMSMAFLLAATWFTIQLVETNAIRFYVLQSLMILLILLSNLTLIYTVLVFLVATLLITIIKNESHLKAFFRRIIIIVLGGLIPLVLAIQVLFELKSRSLLYYGIIGGFWKVTAQTLIELSTGFSFWILSVIVAALLVLIFVIFIKRLSLSKNIRQILQPDFIFSFLLFGNIALFVIMHYFMEVKYPEDRVGMFFIPFFVGSLLLGIDKFADKQKSKWLFFLPVFFVLIPINFLRSANLDYTSYWKEMGIPQRFYDEISESTSSGQLPPVVGAHWLRSYFWAIEDYRNTGELNLLHHADTTESTDDFLIYNIHENPEWRILYDSLDYDEIRDIHLLKRKRQAPREWLYGSERFETDDTLSPRYYMLRENKLDTLDGEDLIFEWNMWLESPEEPFRAAIVIDITDRQGNQLYYSVYELFHQRLAWTHSSGKARNCMKVSNLPEGAYWYKLYLWNQEDQPFMINDAFVNVFRLDKDQ
ncbi:MAG: glycosyltransferase family 39 protein [Bacteroidales bacterium]